MQSYLFCNSIIYLFQILFLSPLLCNAEEQYEEKREEKREEKIQTVLPLTTNIQTVLPIQHDLIKQQADTIREIVRTKTEELELDKPVDEHDPVLLKKCQELAKLQEKTDLKIDDLKKLDEIKPPEIFPNERIDNHPQPQIIASPYGKTWYYIYHRIFPETTEATTERTEPTTTTLPPTTTHEHMFTEKMRFILRMPYPKQEVLSNFPWEFDRYAYLPRHLQPDYVNMPVPYNPMYHMIRRLIVPSKVPGNFVVEAKSKK